jgi:hypothetical protein
MERNDCLSLRTQAFRSFALICEQFARDAPGRTARLEWEETAGDWHELARVAARANDGASERVM